MMLLNVSFPSPTRKRITLTSTGFFLPTVATTAYIIPFFNPDPFFRLGLICTSHISRMAVVFLMAGMAKGKSLSLYIRSLTVRGVPFAS